MFVTAICSSWYYFLGVLLSPTNAPSNAPTTVPPGPKREPMMPPVIAPPNWLLYRFPFTFERE